MTQFARVLEIVTIAVTVLGAAGVWLLLTERYRRRRAMLARRSAR